MEQELVRIIVFLSGKAPILDSKSRIRATGVRATIETTLTHTSSMRSHLKMGNHSLGEALMSSHVLFEDLSERSKGKMSIFKLPHLFVDPLNRFIEVFDPNESVPVESDEILPRAVDLYDAVAKVANFIYEEIT